MKNAKKLLCLLLSLALVFSLSITAFAEDEQTDPSTEPATSTPIEVPNGTKATITANGDDDHTYAIYQIFAGDTDVKENPSTLSNVVWGANAKIPNGQKAGDPVPQSILDELAEYTNTGADAEYLTVLKKYVDLTTDPVGYVQGQAEHDSLEVPTGYYLFKDEGEWNDGDTEGLYVTEIVGDVRFAPKTDTTSSEKKVLDVNDSTGVTTKDTKNGNTEWIDSADYDVGDAVPFQLSAGVPDLSHFAYGYKLVFHDTVEKDADGKEVLTFNSESVSITCSDGYNPPVTIPATGKKPNYDDNGKITDYTTVTNYTVKTGNSVTDGCTFEIEFANLKELYDADGSSIDVSSCEIIVEYKCELNSNAYVGSHGNKNTSHITYTNNPNNKDATDDGKTPDDIVRVFTYETQIHKIQLNSWYNAEADEDGDGEDENGNPKYIPLENAGFTLEKFVADDEGTEKYVVDGEPYMGKWVASAAAVATDETVGDEEYTGTLFTFSGIDDGWYRLSESKTPAGYNTIDPIYFVVEAEHELLDTEPQLTELTAYETDETGAVLQEGEGPDKANVDFGTIETDASGNPTGVIINKILNQAGATLPQTGGMGTTVFYILGGILVLAAIVLLVTKKRMNAEK